MCAIFGLGFLQGHTVPNDEVIKDIIKKMFIKSMARGRTASGLAIISDKGIKVIKKDLPANLFITNQEVEETLNSYVKTSSNDSKNRLLSVIGHCRLKTKGSEYNNINNHPIVRENAVGVHNGVILNDDSLFEKYSRYFKRNGEVDSEIIFALVDHFSKWFPIHDAIQQTTKLIDGNLACAMVHRKHPYITWLFRRRNPCDILLYKKTGLITWASYDGYIKEAISESDDGYRLGKPNIVVMPDNIGLSIDLYKNKVYKFRLENGTKW